MNNIGSAFRTSDAFLISEIILTGITAQPPHRDIHKTALGATDTVSWRYFKQSVDAIQQLKSEGYTILAIEQAERSQMLNSFSPKPADKYALVFGNEVMGVSDEVMNLVDGCLEIPQLGSKHSLNISVSLGVVLWDFVQKLKIFN
jgi:tRNA G18 (ribose-2'-O)-methylase SpoU